VIDVLDEPEIATLRVKRVAVSGGMFVLIGGAIWQLSNFLFNAVAAHALGPAGYATVAAIVGFAYLFGPAFVALQTVASRTTTDLVVGGRGSAIRGTLRFYTKRVLGAGTAASLLVTLASAWIAHVLRVPSVVPIVIIGTTFVFSSWSHLQRGVLQGAKLFAPLGVSSAFEGIMKLGACAILLHLVMTGSVTGPILAIPVAAAAAVCFNEVLLRRLPRSESGPRPVDHPIGYSVSTLATLILLAMLLSADVIVGKRYLPAGYAGIYAAVSLAAKIAFFPAAPLAAFLFPLWSERAERGEDGRKVFLVGVGIMAAIAGAVEVVYLVAPSFVVDRLFGSAFHDASGYLAWAGPVFFLYAVVYLSAMYLLAAKNQLAMWLLSGALVSQLAALYAVHSSVDRIGGVEATVFGVAAAASFATVMAVGRRRAATTP
jgi:O-antigen/teichoic acid export membrane protein